MFGILCFGDSITFGRGDASQGGWTGRLKNYFELQDNYNSLYNLGIPGDSTSDLLQIFEIEFKARAKIKRPEDKFVILIGIGTNDARLNGSEDNPQTSSEKFEQNILKLMKLSKKYNEPVVFIGLTPVDERRTNPYETTFFSNERVKKYNEILKKSCTEQKFFFVNIFDEWKKSEYKQLLDDGLHPNAQGYEKMYQQIKEFLIKNKIIE